MKVLNPSTGNFEEVYVKALDALPIGIILEYPTTDSTKLPTGYMFCDGSAISRTTYSELFALIGTSFGAGDGSTTFNLPTKEGLTTVGIKSSDTDFNAIGKTGGSKYLQAHQHQFGVVKDNDNTNSLGDGAKACNNTGYNSGVNTSKTSGNILNSDGTNTLTTGNSGNLQPYTVSNYIIKVSNTRPITASVVNESNNSTTDTYSCDYINKIGKTLWSGIFTSGSITVPDYSNYTLFAFKVENVWCFGDRNYGIGGIAEYGSYSIKTFAYRVDVSGNTLTIDSVNKGGTDGSTQQEIKEIVGLF